MKTKSVHSWRWYGFDLDGTIADNTNHAFGYGNIGKPIKTMTSLMKRMHKQGCDVRIFTARLGDVGNSKKARQELINHIWEWCDTNLGFRPPIVDRKDASMEALYDDRVKQVVRNKGWTYEDLVEELSVCLRRVLGEYSLRFKDAELMERCNRVLLKCDCIQ